MFDEAEILAVGSELLTPHRIDTNSLFLTARLNEIGVSVVAKTVSGDREADVAMHLQAALARTRLVITTGGLGPTADDVTREAAAKVLGLPLVEDALLLAGIRDRFDRRGMPMPEINRRQAQVPRGAAVLPNPNGTAPGLFIAQDNRLVVLLPGPPRELQPMVDQHVMPRLKDLTPRRTLLRRVLKITGRSESQVEEIAQPIYARWQSPVSTANELSVPIDTTILAAPGQIELHLSASGDSQAALSTALDHAVASLETALAPFVFSHDGRTLEAVVGDLLTSRQWRFAAAESCTGGGLLGRMTDVPGSSAWVIGGVVAYDDRVKTDALDVPATLIQEFGAVSEPVARAMAEGVRARLNADVAVAITGIAGPGGGTPAKPVGTVVIALVTPRPQKNAVRTFAFPGDRETVRRHSTAAALDMVRRALS